MPSLAGKVALVTGATSGIGLETASTLAGYGATVILGVRNLEAGEQVAQDIRKRSPEALVEVGPKLDLASPDSVVAFAQYLNAKPGSLDILVNNAGLGYVKKGTTDAGVQLLTQINFLGPYTLTRLVEGKLVASKARVVNVVSVTSRMSVIKDVAKFFTDFKSCVYGQQKLAGVLFAFELQRRLGNRGLTSVAVDPGAAYSNIWTRSPKMRANKLLQWFVSSFYAPPSDAAKGVVHAATVPWEEECKCKDGVCVVPAQDLRYYSRGLFLSPVLALPYGVAKGGVLAKLRTQVWQLSALVHSVLDWPLRRVSRGKLASKVGTVTAPPAGLDEKVAAELWDAAAAYAKLPAKPHV